MNESLRQEIIEKEVKQLDGESFKDLVFEGWKGSFDNKLQDLIEKKYGVEGLCKMGKLPWDTYNLFTGYKERFYYSDDPIKSAIKYFENTKKFEGLTPVAKTSQPKKTSKKK